MFSGCATTTDKSSVFWTYTLITYDSEQEPEREAEPGLAAGGQVRTPTGEQYGLYLFPLTEQEQTLDLVRTARDERAWSSSSSWAPSPDW